MPDGPEGMVWWHVEGPLGSAYGHEGQPRTGLIDAMYVVREEP